MSWFPVLAQNTLSHGDGLYAASDQLAWFGTCLIISSVILSVGGILSAWILSRRRDK